MAICGKRIYPTASSQRILPYDPAVPNNDVFRLFPIIPSEECGVNQHTYPIVINFSILRATVDPGSGIPCRAISEDCLPGALVELADPPLGGFEMDDSPLGDINIDDVPTARISCRIL